jgi:hypothetical protein
MNHCFGTWLKLFPDTAQLEIPNLKKAKLYHFVEIEEHVYYPPSNANLLWFEFGYHHIFKNRTILKNEDFSCNAVLW